MTLIGPWVQWTPHTPAWNALNLSYVVTGTHPNMKRERHHHQVWMDYLYDTIFKVADSEVKLRFRL